MQGLTLARLSGVWSSNKTFVRYLNTEILQNKAVDGKIYGLGRDDLQPADYIRQTCEIGSRADLDKFPHAAEKFKQKIRTPFMAWSASHHEEVAG